jgi:hypothetical protein
MSTMVWEDLSRGFQKLITDVEGCNDEHRLNILLGSLRKQCGSAGENFHTMAYVDMFSDDVLGFTLIEQFKIPPYEEVVEEGVNYDKWSCSSYYWIYVLAVFSKKRGVQYHCHTANIQFFPYVTPDNFWLEYSKKSQDYRDTYAQFEPDANIVRDHCNASIAVCDLIIEALGKTIVIHKAASSQWQPPDGYIGSKAIKYAHGVPRTTLQTWENTDIKNGKLHRSKLKKDPSSDEKHYPLAWFEARKASHKPRK